VSKPFPLQTLLELARAGNDAAAAQLGAVNGHEREMQKRLQLLLDYRSEYQAHFAQAAKMGMDSAGWRNFREFMDKIDAAVAQQRELVAQARQQVETGQLHWHSEQRKLKSFDTLAQRHRTQAQKAEARQEQREQDEFALKGFLGRQALLG
jgi:flagellar FliJ protein